MIRAMTRFIKLPKSMQRPIAGGCQCSYCKAHPDRVPHWDTIGVDVNDDTRVWTVHYPELPDAR